MYKVLLSAKAQKDREKLINAGLSKKAKNLIEVLKVNPFQNPPPYEKLCSNLNGFYSRRINIKHRLVYTVHEAEKTVVVRSLWSHYEF